MQSLELCITSKCNLRCKHCYQHSEKNHFQLSFDKIIEIVNYCVDKDLKEIIISGGEACIHNDYYKLIDYLINETNLRITLVTNGTMLDVNFFIKLNAQNRINFVISIDGEQENHDERRGFGNYEKTCNTIKLLQDNNYSVKENVTLDEKNFQDFEKIISKELFKNITFMPVGFSGAAKENNNTSLNKKYESLIKNLYQVAEETKNYCRSCKLFPNSLSVCYDGSVYPCSLARDFKLLKMGNVNDKSIGEVIKDFECSEDGKNLLNADLNFLPTCQQCNRSKTCSKGCRIRALKFHNSLNAPDPFACKLNNKGYKEISFNKIYWGDHE